MDNFKANIVKLNKMILYQPVYLDPKLQTKIINKPDLSGKWHKIEEFNVVFSDAPEMRLDSIHTFLGFKNIAMNGGTKYHILPFENNEKRDAYFIKLQRIIELSVEYLKSYGV